MRVTLKKYTKVTQSLGGGIVVVLLTCFLTPPSLAQSGYSVLGHLRYENALRTPLVGVPVQLYAMPGFVVARDTTTAQGQFRFQNIPGGNYFVDASINYSWGGVNATDALRVMQVFSLVITVDSLFMRAADVNANTVVNATDAITLSRRVSLISHSFSAGDFLTSRPGVVLSGVSDTLLLRALSVGDLNASYTPFVQPPVLYLDSISRNSDVAVMQVRMQPPGWGVSARGVCWDIQSGPEHGDSNRVLGRGSADYSFTSPPLARGNTYYFRGFATTSLGTVYSNERTVLVPIELPQVNTQTATATGPFSAVGGGEVVSDGGAAVSVRGLCRNTTGMPTLSNDTLRAGSGTGAFGLVMDNLSPGTLYYVRAFATNSAGTAYGFEQSFATPATLASVSTAPATLVQATQAVLGGQILSDGGSAATARGVCWSRSPSPTTGASTQPMGQGTGSFNATVAGLDSVTLYYVRAYGINSVGTSYGSEISFTTLARVPVLTTTSISQITQSTALSGGTINNDGGAVVSQRGVCWATTPNPTITGNRTQDGAGVGAFSSNLTGLSPSTSYYLRAYATNTAGTAYGQQLQFTTPAPFVCGTSQATDVDGHNYPTLSLNLTINGQLRSVCWFKQNLRVTHYRNGNPIPTGLDTASWRLATAGAMASPNDSAVYDSLYGKLYNWYAVVDPRGVCPAGWHVGTDAEYLALTSLCQNSGYPNTFSNRNGSGNALKSCRQINTPFSAACNTTIHPRWTAHNNTNPHYGRDAFGFAGLPAGTRVGDDGTFQAFGGNLLLLTPQVSSTDLPYGYFLRFDGGDFRRATGLKPWGGSVRCVRDY
ncbi:MAG: FISUMP domain-containing protein [Bacteroidia bacterium]